MHKHQIYKPNFYVSNITYLRISVARNILFYFFIVGVLVHQKQLIKHFTVSN